MDNPENHGIGANIDAESKQAAGADLDNIGRQTHARVLIVDDDLDFIEMLKLILRQAGFDVAGATNSHIALEKCTEIKPDVILLDLMIPGVDGWGIYQILREITRAPVIVVSASGNRDYVVHSLEMGIYDYISKPFYNPEIIARINRALASIERTTPNKVKLFPNENLRVDMDSQEVVLYKETVQLLPREFKFLAILVENAPKKVSYKVLCERMWGEDNYRTRSHLKTIAFSLRRKMEEDPTRPRLILNYRGMGYKLEASTAALDEKDDLLNIDDQ
ncbi:MAG: response regulator transcription factor [Chloroflexota bacterium]